MGLIFHSRRAQQAFGAILLLCLSMEWPDAQAQTQTSHGLEASAQHVAGDLRDAVAKMQPMVERYGGGFILLARFLDGPRQLNGIVAGVLEMRWWVFTAFNVLGAVLWVGIWGLGTYYLSEHLVAIEAVLRRINPWVAGCVVVGTLALLLYLFLGRRCPAD